MIWKRIILSIIILAFVPASIVAAETKDEQKTSHTSMFSNRKSLGEPIDKGIWVLERYEPTRPDDPPIKGYYYIEKYDFGPLDLYVFMNGTKPKSQRQKMAVWFKEEEVLLMQVPSWRVGMLEDLVCKKEKENHFECQTFSMPEFYVPEYFRPETEIYYQKRIIREDMQFKVSDEYIKQIIQPIRYVLRKVE